MEEKRKGLIIVFTGEGKGKTTAALGTALRGLGHDMKIIMIQFLKGAFRYGELDAVKELKNLEIHPMGAGFICKESDLAEEKERVKKAWDFCKEKIRSEEYDVVIMDEINYVIHYGLLLLDEVARFLKERPAGVHLVLTGRDAKPELVEMADLVTEMKNIKHPYESGIKAQKGIEY